MKHFAIFDLRAKNGSHDYINAGLIQAALDAQSAGAGVLFFGNHSHVPFVRAAFEREGTRTTGIRFVGATSLQMHAELIRSIFFSRLPTVYSPATFKPDRVLVLTQTIASRSIQIVYGFLKSHLRCKAYFIWGSEFEIAFGDLGNRRWSNPRNLPEEIWQRVPQVALDCPHLGFKQAIRAAGIRVLGALRPPARRAPKLVAPYLGIASRKYRLSRFFLKLALYAFRTQIEKSALVFSNTVSENLANLGLIVTSIPTPILLAEEASSIPQIRDREPELDGDILRLALVGNGYPPYSWRFFLSLEELMGETQRVEIIAANSNTPKFETFPFVRVFQPRPLSREMVRGLSSSSHFVCFLYPNFGYRYSASGAVLEALALRRPHLSVWHPQLNELTTAHNMVGKFFRSPEELASFVSEKQNRPELDEIMRLHRATRTHVEKSYRNAKGTALERLFA